MKHIACALTALLMASPAGALTLIKDGEPKAIIVTADSPGPVAKYAAAEFVDHVEKATGVRLAVTTESKLKPGTDGCVFIGDCHAVRAAVPSARLSSAVRIIGPDVA